MALSVEFTAFEVAGLRRRCQEVALAAGLPPDRAAMFVTAVNEALANAVVHGGGRGCCTLTVTGSPRSIVAEIADEGSGFDPHQPRVLPEPHDPGGRGLWMADHLADTMTVATGRHGTTVVLEMFLAPRVGFAQRAARASVSE